MGWNLREVLTWEACVKIPLSANMDKKSEQE